MWINFEWHNDRIFTPDLSQVQTCLFIVLCKSVKSDIKMFRRWNENCNLDESNRFSATHINFEHFLGLFWSFLNHGQGSTDPMNVHADVYPYARFWVENVFQAYSRWNENVNSRIKDGPSLEWVLKMTDSRSSTRCWPPETLLVPTLKSQLLHGLQKSASDLTQQEIILFH